MTPEQRASLPAYPTPDEAILQDACVRVARLKHIVRASRVLKASMEYPVGHSQRCLLPRFVAEWERDHGPAPASAERFLETFGTKESQ